MGSSPAPLSVLDLSPVVTGQTAADALRNTIDLARQTERLGYRRYWLAEHHLVPGVAASSPAVLAASVLAATETLRVGSGAVLLGSYPPLVVAEQFGTLAQLHPGRVDLGVGRAGVIRAAELISKLSAPNPDSPAARDRIVDGLLIPARPKVKIETSGLVERFLAQQRLVGDRGEAAADYGRDVREILAFFAGDYRESDDTDFHAVQAEGVDLEVWVLGSSRGASSAAAGSLGLPFGANYHVSPTSVIDAVAGYRDAFVPSARLAKPYVAVSADVVVAEDEAKARELASGYGQWVLSVRSGLGAIEFPSPAEAAEFEWTDELREAVSDRTRTQFVGTPEQVGGQLATLRDATRADELVVTTITHEHADRVRSYELLAKSWANLNH